MQATPRGWSSPGVNSTRLMLQLVMMKRRHSCGSPGVQVGQVGADHRPVSDDDQIGGGRRLAIKRLKVV